MGTIKSEVREQHLRQFPDEESVIRPFLNGFDITWARRRRAYNSELSVYFLKPESFMAESYGFNREILLVYSPFDQMQARTIQGAESFLNESPADGRVEKINFFLISDFSGIEEWINKYISERPESRIIVPFCSSDLIKNKDNSYYIRNIINKYLYGRDLFNYRLPLKKDIYFFGRKDIISSLRDTISRCENRGLFGLRKTGKTSILNKLQRESELENLAEFFIYDCESPSIRMLKWNQLYERICNDITDRFKIDFEGNYDEVHVADTFSELICRTESIGKIVLIFDEIEFISPNTLEDAHWKKDFIKFWHTFRACQSIHRNVCAILCGVNPYPVEISAIDGVPNPLFGIVPAVFVKGFEYNDMRMMVRALGKKMGMAFEEEALEYLYERYGGHPLLTRIACSMLNTTFNYEKETKPIHINYEKMMKYEESQDSNLMSYYTYVLSELKQFYKDEYEMLELLASNQIPKFLEKSNSLGQTNHLENYGLLSFNEKGIPKVSIPVIERYVGLECARREGRKTIYRVVDADNRSTWLNSIMCSIISDLNLLEKLIQSKKMPSLFGPGSFGGAEELSEVKVVESKEDYRSFLNIIYRCFVESIDIYGESTKGKTKYFFEDIKREYPALWEALYRIRLYRNAIDHRLLKEGVNKGFLEFIKRDLEGKSPSQVDDLYFVIQQCILDSLLTGILVESNRLSK